jgi:hypothetical protein
MSQLFALCVQMPTIHSSRTAWSNVVQVGKAAIDDATLVAVSRIQITQLADLQKAMPSEKELADSAPVSEEVLEKIKNIGKVKVCLAGLGTLDSEGAKTNKAELEQAIKPLVDLLESTLDPSLETFSEWCETVCEDETTLEFYTHGPDEFTSSLVMAGQGANDFSKYLQFYKLT